MNIALRKLNNKKSFEQKIKFSNIILTELERQFQENNYISDSERVTLGEKLGLTKYQVAQWFSRRRRSSGVRSTGTVYMNYSLSCSLYKVLKSRYFNWQLKSEANIFILSFFKLTLFKGGHRYKENIAQFSFDVNWSRMTSIPQHMIF